MDRSVAVAGDGWKKKREEDRSGLSRSRWTAVVNDSRQEDCVGRFGSRRDQCCCRCKAVF
jgi:hypothetical protein